ASSIISRDPRFSRSAERSTELDEAGVSQALRCEPNGAERQAGRLGDPQQIVGSVAEVQHPELGPLDFLLLGEAAERGVEAASPELRLAERTEVQRRRVCLQDAGDLETHLDRVGERVGRDEVQVVSRAVVLPELPPRRPHETTYGKVESRRAVLTLVVAG